MVSCTFCGLAGHCHCLGCLSVAVKGSQLLTRTVTQLTADKGGHSDAMLQKRLACSTRRLTCAVLAGWVACLHKRLWV